MQVTHADCARTLSAKLREHMTKHKKAVALGCREEELEQAAVPRATTRLIKQKSNDRAPSSPRIHILQECHRMYRNVVQATAKQQQGLYCDHCQN